MVAFYNGSWYALISTAPVALYYFHKFFHSQSMPTMASLALIFAVSLTGATLQVVIENNRVFDAGAFHLGSTRAEVLVMISTLPSAIILWAQGA